MSRFIVPMGFSLAAIVSVAIWWYLPLLGPIGEQMKLAGILVAAVISFALWYNLPMLGEFGHQMRAGGPLVALLIMLVILLTAFIFERIWSLRKARGGRVNYQWSHNNKFVRVFWQKEEIDKAMRKGE